MIKLYSNLQRPLHRIKVLVVGVGGTGAVVARELASFSKQLKMIGEKPLDITLCDGDIVSEHNIGKQMNFYDSDINQNKAVVLASRINRSIGTDVKAIGEYLSVDSRLNPYDFIIGCVDSIEARWIINDHTKKDGVYWIDCGNSKNSGQIIISNVKQGYNSVVDLYPDAEDNSSEPSCSAYQSLREQSFAVNRFIASIFITMFSDLLMNYELPYSQVWFNLDKLSIRTNAKLLKDEIRKSIK